MRKKLVTYSVLLAALAFGMPTDARAAKKASGVKNIVAISSLILRDLAIGRSICDSPLARMPRTGMR